MYLYEACCYLQGRGGGGGGIPPPRPAQTQPAILQPTEQPPPYTENSAQKINTDDLQKRQEVSIY